MALVGSPVGKPWGRRLPVSVGSVAPFQGADTVMDFANGYYRREGIVYGSADAVPSLTYTRTGDATAWRTDGTLAEFAPNVPRITDRGVLIEGQRTNLFARWDPTAVQIAIRGACVDVPEPTLAPLSGRKWVAFQNAPGVDAYGYMDIPAGVPAATTLTLSVLVYSEDGTQPVYGVPNAANDFTVLVNAAFLNDAVTSYRRLLGNVWLFTITGKSRGDETSTRGGIARYRTHNQRPLKFSGFQLEQASNASSPIITTGAAATRGADNLALVLPAGVTSYSAEYGDNLTATGPATPGPFDLATGRPWLNSVLRRIIFS